MEIEIFSALVEEIYSAALEPSRWEATALAIQAYIGGHSVNLVAHDSQCFEFDYALASAVDGDQLAFFEQEILPRDELIALFEQIDAPGTLLVSEHYRDDELPHLFAFDAFYRDVGYHRFNCGLLRKSERSRAWISVIRSLDDPRFTQADRARLASLMPHLIRALDVNQLLGERDVYAGFATATIERLSTPVYLLDHYGFVLHRNQTADRLADHLPLRIRHNRLEPLDSKAAAKLDNLLRTSGGSIGAEIAIDGPIRGLLVCQPVAPLIGDNFLWLGERQWIVFVVLPGSPPAVPESLLQATYNLTPTEARVAASIAAGSPPAEIAVAMNVTVDAVRFHLKNIYDKTGTRGQARLITRLLGTLVFYEGSDANRP